MTTQTTNPLSQEQLDSFRLNGFLHIPQLVPQHELEAAQRDTEVLIQRGHDEQLDDSNYNYGADASDKGRKCLFRIDNLISHFGNESFKMLLAYPPLLRAIQQAVGEDHFVPTMASCVFKIPHRGYPVPWHQDNIDVYRFPVFNVDVYLDEATPDNGCLYAIPGSHLAGYHGDPEWVQSWTQGKEYDAPNAIPIVTKPGDVIFHSTTVLHGSFWNRSNSMRRTIYFHIDHLQDVNLRPEEKRNVELYLKGQQLTAEAIELRRAKHPDEEAFDYKLIESL